MDWEFIIKEFGPMFGLVFFLLWREQKREEECRKRLKEKDKFINTTLVHLIERVNDALNRQK